MAASGVSGSSALRPDHNHQQETLADWLRRQHNPKKYDAEVARVEASERRARRARRAETK